MKFNRLKHVFVLMHIVFMSNQAFSQVEFLLNPTKAELTLLADLFEETGKVVPLAIIYEPKGFAEGKLLAIGIPSSLKIRNGVHSALLMSTNEEFNSYEKIQQEIDRVNTSGGRRFAGATLFLEKTSDGEVVLSSHGWNSFRSNLNGSQSRELPRDVTQEIVDITGLKAQGASPKLVEAINVQNFAKYIGEDAKMRVKNDDTLRLYRTNPPKENEESATIRDSLVNKIKQNWKKGQPVNPCDTMKFRLYKIQNM